MYDLWLYKTLGKEEACRLCEAIKKFYFAVWAVTKVTDDKSVVCLMNEKAKVTPKEQKYYQEPNWKWRQECYQALLYGKELPPAPSDDPLYTGEKTTVQKPLRKVPEREMVEPPIHTPPHEPGKTCTAKKVAKGTLSCYDSKCRDDLLGSRFDRRS